MDAKEYLMQVQKMRASIDRDIERLDALRLSAMSPRGVRYDAVRGQGSQDGGLCDRVGAIVELNLQVNGKIESYLDLKEKVRGQIARLPDETQRAVLNLVYIHGFTVKGAAEAMGISVSYAFVLKRKALEAFGLLLGE